MKSEISIVKCKSYDSELVFKAVKRSLDLLGGISNFIKPGSRVLVKPNMLMAKEPEFGICTHPEIVRSVIRLLKEIDCKIFVGDSPSVWGNQIENVDQVYEVTGIHRVCDEEGVDLVKFEKRRFHKYFPLTTWLDNCDCVVNLAKFKTHGFTLLTAAIKNLFGFVVGTYKTELHKNYFTTESFSKMLVDVFQEVRPSLTLVDGIIAMEGDGPATSGKLRESGIIVAGADCVAIDSVLAHIMGIKPHDVVTTKEASGRGLGVAELENIEIRGDKLEDVKGEPFIIPQASMKQRLPAPVVKLAQKLIKYYPCAERDNCIRCAACIKACPKKIITMKEKGIVFDYSKCIACFCCQEVCPAKAIKIKKSLFARIIGL